MSKLKLSSKFGLITIGTYALVILVGVAAAPTLQAYIDHRSEGYAKAARSAENLGKKVGNYRLALALDPHNARYRNELATVYVRQNNLEAAINVLGGTAGERERKAGYQLSLGRYEQAARTIESLNTPESAIISSKIAMEQGSGEKAYKAVLKARNDSERLQLGLSYAAVGINDIAGRVVSQMGEGESKRRLQRAQGGGVALAQELYQEKCYRSAERILEKAGESSEKFLLLAHVQLELPGKNDRAKLEAARDSLQKGIERDPADLETRRFLAQIYRQLKDGSGVAREEQIVQKLQSGKL